MRFPARSDGDASQARDSCIAKGTTVRAARPRFFTAERTLVRNDNSLMNVLVDTPVWSLALRRRAPDLNVRERALTGALSELIREGRVQMIGSDPAGVALGHSRGRKVCQAAELSEGF
jgi:hypothetical protein